MLFTCKYIYCHFIFKFACAYDRKQAFVCTTGKDGRRTHCRVAHVCDKQGTCNYTLPVCAVKRE